MIEMCARVTYAALSSIARMHSFAPDDRGSVMSNCMNDGEACTQRCAFMTFEKTPMTPFDPGGTVDASSSITTYGSTPRRRASSTSRPQNPSRNHRIVSPHRNPMPSTIHWPGTAWHSVRSRPCGSMSGWSTVTACCQNVPPTTASVCGASRPSPTRASWVSAPPTTTGVPCASPVSAAASCETSPHTVPDSRTGGNTAGSNPQIAMISADHDRVAEVEHARARSRRRIGDEAAGQSVQDPVAEHRHVGCLVHDAGLVGLQPQQPWRRRDRHPVAGELVDPLRVPAGDQALRLGGRSRVGVRARPELASVVAVQHDSLAHAGRADRGDRLRIDARAVHHVANARADQLPVPRGVELLRPGMFGQWSMRPLALGDGRPGGRRRRRARRGSSPCRRRSPGGAGRRSRDQHG